MFATQLNSSNQGGCLGSNAYLILTSMECLIPHKHTLKILYKSKHFPPRYKRKREWVFFNTVYNVCMWCLFRFRRPQDENLLPFLQFVDDTAPVVQSPRQVRPLTVNDGDVDVSLPAALLLDRLLISSRTNTEPPPATTGSVLLRRLVKRQPYQCLVNVVACWKR